MEPRGASMNEANMEGVVINDMSPGTEHKLGEAPSQFVRQSQKLVNTLISSATMGMLRALMMPPTAAPPPDASNLPDWFVDEYKKKSLFKQYSRQFLWDIVAFTGAAYVMDGVEYAVKSVRGGAEDFINKTFGGMAAGGVLAQVWYPRQPRSLAILTGTGAVVGYISWVAERSTKQMLLAQQQKLEKDVLHKQDGDLRRDVDPYYLRDLIRLKQEQLIKMQRAKEQAQQLSKEQAQQAPSMTDTSSEDAGISDQVPSASIPQRPLPRAPAWVHARDATAGGGFGSRTEPPPTAPGPATRFGGGQQAGGAAAPGGGFGTAGGSAGWTGGFAGSSDGSSSSSSSSWDRWGPGELRIDDGSKDNIQDTAAATVGNARDSDSGWIEMREEDFEKAR